MSAKSLFTGFLKKLRGVIRKAPPPTAAFAPPVAQRVFAPTGEEKRATDAARISGGIIPTARIVPAGVREATGTQEAGGEFEPSTPTDAAVQEFLYFGQWFDKFRSSNVARTRYDNAEQILYVEFISHGSTYEYPGVDVDLAYTFAMALSKGKWAWENLRNAGRAYRFLFSADGHVPVRGGGSAFSGKAEKRVRGRLAARHYERSTATKQKGRGLFAVFGKRKG